MGGVEMNYLNETDPILIAVLAAKGGGVSQEQIQEAVDAYLEENPVRAGELQLNGTTINLEGGNN